MVTPPFTTAEITLISGTMDWSVPIATPSAPVGAVGCVSSLPAPVTVSVTVAPGTGSPRPSRTLMVMTDRPVTTSIVAGDAVTLERSGLGSFRTSSTAVAVKLTTGSPAPTTSASTRCSPSASPSTQVVEAAPSSSVRAVSGEVAPPSAPAPSSKATLTPGTGRPCASVTLATIGCGSSAPTRPV
jgi:hypothetical protein